MARFSRLITSVVALSTIVVVLTSTADAAKRPWIGIYMQNVDRDMIEAYDLKTDYGVFISSVADDSPAEKAGLEARDILLAWNGTKLADSDQLSELVSDSDVGDKVDLLVNRAGKEMTITLEIGERREPRVYGFGFDSDDESSPPNLAWLDDFRTTGIGVSLQSLSGDLGEYFGVPEGRGALVTEVKDDSPAAAAGLKVADVIVAVAGRKVEAPSDVSAEIREFKKGDKVELTVIRNKAEQKLTVEVDEIENFGFDFEGNMPSVPGLDHNWMRGFNQRYHNWTVPGIDRDDMTRKMEELQKRLEELQLKLESLEQRVK